VLPLFCWAALVIHASSADTGLNPSKAITRFHQNVWGTEEGLPQNTVPAIAQSTDGYLWLGTELGLVRFDGLHFAIFDKSSTPELKSNKVDVLLADRANGLWIGTLGGGLARLNNGKFSSFGPKQGLSSGSVLSLLEDRAGNLWIGTDGGGLNCLRNGRFTVYTTRDGLPDNEIFALAEDQDGSIWIGTHEGLSHLTHGVFQNYGIRDGLPVPYVRCLYMSAQGTLWIGTNGGGLSSLRNGAFHLFNTKDGLPSNAIASIREDSRGSLWIGTIGGGLARMTGNTFSSYKSNDGLPSNDVWSIFQDRDENLWIGTGGGGLARLFDGDLFTAYGTKDGLSSPVTLPIYEDAEGTLWIGTNGGGLNRFRDGKFSTLTTKDGLADNLIFSICGDREGTLWIGTRKGLNRLKNGKLTTYTKSAGLPSDIVGATLVDHDGTLWIGTRAGLGQWKNGKFTTYTTKDGMSSNVVRTIYEDRQQRLWIGTAGGGLNVFAHGRFEVFDSRRGLSNDVVLAIHESAGGVLWVGTDGGGLNRLKDGKFTSFTTRDGLLDDAVFRILEDDSGHLWMSSNKGVFRVSIRSLNERAEKRAGRIPMFAYGTPDGMKTRECNGGFQPAGWKGRDGRLWFPTMKGIVVVDPRKAESGGAPLRVLFEQAFVDEREMNVTSGIEAPPGRGELEFRYSAPNFRSPERVVFKYKLEGFDRDWIDAGTRRVAYYTNIPSGHYRFQVIGSNGGGTWSAASSSLDLFLKPHFYQTLWFYGVCLFALVGLVAGGHVTHVRHLRERKKDLERRVDARTVELRNEIAERERTELELVKAKEAAEKASRVKSEFLANMSHEIRTPMNGMLGMLEHALATESTTEQRKYLGIVKHSADSLLSVIKDILDFSKVEAGRLDLDPVEFNLRENLDEMVRSTVFRAEQKGLRLICDVGTDVPENVTADPLRLGQIILNLLGNAIKFTERGEIVLRVVQQAAFEAEYCFLHFTISDTGIGIPREKLKSIFEAFSQVDSSTTRQFGGSGLGLAICSRLVQLMGGEIWVESELHRGAEFHFTVRVGVADVRRASEERDTGLANMRKAVDAAPNGIRRLEILLAEDNPANQMVARLTLERAGFRVQGVENGREAVDAVCRGRFDVVLMDCRMPVMDGYAAARQIRQLSGAMSRVPIIALTANAYKEDRQRAEQAGMDDFISKPFESQELIAKCLAWSRADGGETVADGGELDEALRSVLEMFLESAPPMFENLLDAIGRDNWEDARASAHWLRGGASRMLNPDLQQRLEHLEKKFGDTSPRVSSVELESLRASFESARKSAEAWLAEHIAARIPG
jgi:signal transduction histidine kinase/ligand-binding sensor domain-containing protein/DNA-binding NarL/FixJ family response regulator